MSLKGGQAKLLPGAVGGSKGSGAVQPLLWTCTPQLSSELFHTTVAMCLVLQGKGFTWDEAGHKAGLSKNNLCAWADTGGCERLRGRVVGSEDLLGVVLNSLPARSYLCPVPTKEVTCSDSGVGVGTLSPFWPRRRRKRPSQATERQSSPGDPLSQAPTHRSTCLCLLHLLQQPLAETVLLLYSFWSMVGVRGHRSQTTQGLC